MRNENMKHENKTWIHCVGKVNSCVMVEHVAWMLNTAVEMLLSNTSFDIETEANEGQWEQVLRIRIPYFWDLRLWYWVTCFLNVVRHPATQRRFAGNQHPRLFLILHIISGFTYVFQHWSNKPLTENNSDGKLTLNIAAENTCFCTRSCNFAGQK